MTIDLDKLLSPISDTAPTGVNLRDTGEDATFATIAELRREIDPALGDAEARAANWPAVMRACEQMLNTRSKDLQLAAWLTEALAQLEGFAGMHAGLQLIHGLCGRYWETLHPGAAGEAGVDAGPRARWLSWLSSPKGLLPSVKAIRLIGKGGKREDWIPWEAYLEAQLLEATASTSQERYAEMIEAGAMTRERWNAAVAVTPLEQLRAELEALLACESELLALETDCAQRFGSDDAPVFVELRGLLSEVREFLQSRLPKEAGGTADASQDSAPGSGASISGPIGSRQQALVRLREVADFFRQTEPHSPLPHLIDRAVRWAGMSFEELLLDVMKSNDSLTPMWNTLGIKAPPPEQGA